MITANEANKLQKELKNLNNLAIVKAMMNWENECYVCLGSNLTDEQLAANKQKYIDAGYTILDEQNYRTHNPFTPITEQPVISRIKISW